MQMLYQQWYLPKTADFVRDSAQLKPAIQAVCDAKPDAADTARQRARECWIETVASWENLNAVAIGPLVVRRSQRQIDFMPTRSRMIEKAVQSAPASLADLELIGTPAKGLPALEWLLWVKPIQPASAECRYATLLAEEIMLEAQALHVAFTQAAGRARGQAADKTELAEWINQWVGGIERLRWADMEMPVRVVMTSKKQIEPQFSRYDRAAVTRAWASQWQALRTQASAEGYSLQAVVRASGQQALAEALAAAVRKTDQAMQGLQAEDHARVLTATAELMALKRLVEDKVASALGVSIGFSDADGD